MKRVLIPVDGNRSSMEALRATLREGAGAIERIELLNVQPLLNRHIARWVPKSERDGWRGERAARALEGAKAMLQGSSIPWRTHAATGPVATSIADAARQLGVDEIVVGSARRGPLGRLLANSTATRLCEISRVPVRVVPTVPAPKFERLALPAGLGLIALMFLADE